MLIPKNNLGNIRFKLSALLLIISVFTFLPKAEAKSKLNIAENYLEKGYEAQDRGKLGEALTYFRKAAELGLEDAQFYNDLGILFEQVGDHLRAERAYLSAIGLDQTFLPAYSNLAYLYLDLDNSSQAEKYFKLRYEFGPPDDPWTEQAKEELLKLRPSYKHWIAAMKADKLNYETEVYKARKEEREKEAFESRIRQADEHFKAGEQLSKLGQYNEAKKEYRKALRLTPNNPKVLNAITRVKLEEAKQNIRTRTETAILNLESGDQSSAEEEIRKILSTISNEP